MVVVSLKIDLRGKRNQGEKFRLSKTRLGFFLEEMYEKMNNALLIFISAHIL
jgi:hypothetical protein